MKNYEPHLLALLNGLKVENIPLLMKEPPEVFGQLGEVMSQLTRDKLKGLKYYEKEFGSIKSK